MELDVRTVMAPATAATLPYRTRHAWLRRIWDALCGRAGAAARAREEGAEHAPTIARGALRPHSGRGPAVIDLREEAHGDPIPERQRLLDVAEADELQARGRAVALGLVPQRTPAR